MHNLGRTFFVILLCIFGLMLGGCDRTFDPDMGQRNSTAETVISAAKNGDQKKLLELALVDMQEREAGANELITKAQALASSGYEIQYQEHHGAPDNYLVTASDNEGDDLTFELDWHESRWQLALGTAGPPKSPAATP